MHHLSHRATTLLTAAVLTFGVAGCGEDEPTAGGTPTSPIATTAAGTTPTTPTTPTDTGAAGDKESGGKAGSKDDAPAGGGSTGGPAGGPVAGKVTDPPAAGGETSLPKRAAVDLISVRSRGGQGPKWRVSGRSQRAAGSDTFCVAVARVGNAQPDPVCQPTTLLVLSLAGEESAGPANASVETVPRTARTKAEDIVVAGVVPDSVERVTVKYGSKTETARISSSSSTIAIDKRLAAGLSGKTRKALPRRMKVRVFGVSFPTGTGNPPTSAVPTSGDATSVTLTLQ